MSSSPPAAPAPKNDLERIEAKLDHLILVVETRRALVEGFDDRLDRADKLEKSLASTMLKLAASRFLSNGGAGAVAGAVAGAIVVGIAFLSGIASAH
jgi:hypothetical protein